MTLIEKIAYHTKQLSKVISSHGADSDYTAHAFFLLHAVKMEIADPYKWANDEVARLHQLALDQLPSMLDADESNSPATSNPNDRMTVNDVIGQVSEIIKTNVPSTVEGMPYAKTFVFERVANRLAEPNPLIIADNDKYKHTMPVVKDAVEAGAYNHYPTLEEHALEITKTVLRSINDHNLDPVTVSKVMEERV